MEDHKNKIYTFKWGYQLTQADIDNHNLALKLQYDFAIGVLTVSPAGRFTSVLSTGLRTVTKHDMASLLIAAGVTNVIVNQIFSGASKTKFKVGDVIIVEGGKIVSIGRDGVVHNASDILGSSYGVGSGAGSGGE